MAKKKSLVEKVLGAAKESIESQEQPAKEAAPKAEGKAVKVRAISLGYYGNMRRRAGDVFYLKPFVRVIERRNPVTKQMEKEEKYISALEQFSEEWMELAEKNEKLVSQPPQKSFGKHSMPEESAKAARAVHEPHDEEAEPGSGDKEVI